jgi:hypothetical protein
MMPRTAITIPPSPKVPPSPKQQQQQPSAAATAKTPSCSICQQLDADYSGPQTSKAEQQQPMVRCSACHLQMHSSCIDMPLSMVEVVRQYDWLCIDCKRCCICEQPDQEVGEQQLLSFY